MSPLCAAACVRATPCLLACLETGPVPAYSHALERRSGPRYMYQHKYRVLAPAPPRWYVGVVLLLSDRATPAWGAICRASRQASVRALLRRCPWSKLRPLFQIHASYWAAPEGRSHTSSSKGLRRPKAPPWACQTTQGVAKVGSTSEISSFIRHLSCQRRLLSCCSSRSEAVPPTHPARG